MPVKRPPAPPLRVIAALRELDARLDLLDDRVAARLEIGRSDLRAMEIISREGGSVPGQLARTLRLTTGSVTAVIDRLVKAGLVRRREDRHDRRKTLLELTPSGRERERRIFGPLAGEMARALGRYTDTELGLIAGFVATVTDVANRFAYRLDARAAAPANRPRRTR